MNVVKDIENLNIGEVVSDINLRDYTTYKLEGSGLCVVSPDDVNGLIKLLKYLKNNDIKYKVIGNGSNLIFVNSVIFSKLIFSNKFAQIKWDNKIYLWQ